VPESLRPKLITVLQEGYTRDQFQRDAIAGVTVGVVALPLAIAFAIASGVGPERGLYTAIVAGFLISLLSGSRVQIGGPTGAFVVLVYGIVGEHGYDGLATATLIAGVILVAMGLARLGSVIKYIPYPVTVGFTSGIALIIFSGQIGDLLGMPLDTLPPDLVGKWQAYAGAVASINPWAAAVGFGAILLTVAAPRVTHRVPGSLLGIIAATVAVQLFDLPVETIGTRFGEVPSTLPIPRLPEVSWELATRVMSPAVSIALLGGIESLLSAVVADGMTGRRHRSNTELVAQGIANIASPLFGGIPATGALARTATNVKAGGRTPVAGIVHAVTLLLIMLFFGRWAALIPLAALAGILVVVAYNMSEWHLFVRLFRSTRSDTLVLLVTFGLTILFDLVVAIQVGVVLAALLFMRRMAEVAEVGFVDDVLDGDGDGADAMDVDPSRLRRSDLPSGVEVFEVAGPFFFGATDKFRSALTRVDTPPRTLILRLRHVPAIDATAVRALEDILQRCEHDGTRLLLSGVNPRCRRVLDRSGFSARLGETNYAATIETALQEARAVNAVAE